TAGLAFVLEAANLVELRIRAYVRARRWLKRLGLVAHGDGARVYARGFGRRATGRIDELADALDVAPCRSVGRPELGTYARAVSLHKDAGLTGLNRIVIETRIVSGSTRVAQLVEQRSPALAAPEHQ